MGRAWPLSENAVRVPSDMIAGSDYKLQSDPDNDFDPINLLADIPSPRHKISANVVFCDDHIEFAKQKRWLEKSERARRRFNTDNAPHPELWFVNP
jgi:hypothetical protein